MGLVDLMAKPLPEEGRTMVGQGLTEQMGRRRGQRGNRPGIGPNEDARDPGKGAGTSRFEPGAKLECRALLAEARDQGQRPD